MQHIEYVSKAIELQKKGELEAAYKMYEKALKLASGKAKLTILHNQMVLADAITELKRGKEREEWVNIEIHKAETLIHMCKDYPDDFRQLAMAHLFAGKAYIKKGLADRAKVHLSYAVEYAQQARDRQTSLDAVKEFQKVAKVSIQNL